MLSKDQITRLYDKAQRAQKVGQLDEATKLYRKIGKDRPGLAEIPYNLALIAQRRGNVQSAAQQFEAALRIKPGEPAIWLAYLDMAARHPRVDNLEKLLLRMGQLGPGLEAHPKIAAFRALVVKGKGRADQAREMLEQALERGVAYGPAHLALADLYVQNGEDERALDQIDLALKLNAKDDVALARKADLLRNLGQYDAALETIRKAIEIVPNAAALYYSYASIAKVQPDDPMIGRMRQLMKALPKTSYGHVFLGHALAKAMEDTGQQDRIWPYLSAANTRNAALFPYDYAQDQQDFARYRALFEGMSQSGASERTDPANRTDTSGPTPIFVTGMPRSGTTLVEQIIAAHSLCEAGGELALLGPAIAEAVARAENEKTALSSALIVAGQTYRAQLAHRFPNARYVTDKSITSYAMIGQILHAMPDAKIIVVRRDPADNALSIFKNLFRAGTHRYASDLGNIARIFRLFEQQLSYWQRVLPGSFTEMAYEDLISDPVAGSHQIVAHAGLEWEEGCLSFHERSGRVDTLSTTQVRQPIYASSVGRWQGFQAEMAPFFEHYAAASATMPSPGDDNGGDS